MNYAYNATDVESIITGKKHKQMLFYELSLVKLHHICLHDSGLR